MEEILASIRKIISEDQPPEAGKPAAKASAPKPQPIPDPPKPRVVVPIPAPIVAAAPVAELDVLDLTDEVDDEDAAPPVRLAPAAAAPVIEDDVIFQNIEAAPKMPELSTSELSADDDDLISDNTRHAMGRAFSNMNGHAPHVALKGGNVESIFAEAVQQAFRPALTEWIDDHSSDVMDQLRPLIRAWMDEHLPPLIEAAVVKEIARAAQRARKP